MYKSHQTIPNQTHSNLTRPEWFGVISKCLVVNYVFLVWFCCYLFWNDFVWFYCGMVRSQLVCFYVVLCGLVIGRTLQNRRLVFHWIQNFDVNQWSTNLHDWDISSNTMRSTCLKSHHYKRAMSSWELSRELHAVVWWQKCWP